MDNNQNISDNMKLYQPGTQNIRAQMQNTENNVNAQAMEYRTVYPEVYYKLQPYIMMVCDQMDTYGTTMPSQDMIENMSDNIYEDMCQMYPDIADYVKSTERTADTEAVETITPLRSYGGRGRDFGRFGGRFRRRGVFRDLIGILLMSEFFRRRRRY